MYINSTEGNLVFEKKACQWDIGKLGRMVKCEFHVHQIYNNVRKFQTETIMLPMQLLHKVFRLILELLVELMFSLYDFHWSFVLPLHRNTCLNYPVKTTFQIFLALVNITNGLWRKNKISKAFMIQPVNYLNHKHWF